MLHVIFYGLSGLSTSILCLFRLKKNIVLVQMFRASFCFWVFLIWSSWKPNGYFFFVSNCWILEIFESWVPYFFREFSFVFNCWFDKYDLECYLDCFPCCTKFVSLFFSPFSGAKIAFEITVTRVYVHTTCYAEYKHTHQLYVYRHLAYTIECSDECTGINLINRHIAY